jgi:hypothetical protein
MYMYLKMWFVVEIVFFKFKKKIIFLYRFDVNVRIDF